MPTYDNVLAATTQIVIVDDGPNNISYSTIALVPGINHQYQLEVERIFTNDLNGLSAGALVIKNFLANAEVNIEVKRKLFIIPSSYITYNDTNKTLTVANLTSQPYTYVASGGGYSYSIPVPPIVNGDKLTIRRKTISNIPLVSWTAGTKLTSNQLNLMTTQLLYLQQEVLDRVFYQAILSGDSVTALNNNSVNEEKLTANSVSTSKIQSLAVTNDKIALGGITYDRINTANPWAVDLMNTQAITGTKTFSNLKINSSFIFSQTTPPSDSNQYILSYNGDGVGGIQWALNNPWNNLPSYVLKTDTDQTITGNKTVSGNTIIQGTLKISGQTPTQGKVLAAQDNTGLTTWSDTVNSIKLGSSSATPSTGVVTVTPALIGALPTTGGTITGSTTFNTGTTTLDTAVQLGTSTSQDVEVRGTLKYRPSNVTPASGKVLMTGASGVIGFYDPVPTGITSITMGVGGNVETSSNITITPSKINALSLVDTAVQTVAGPVIFSDTLIIGDNAAVDNLTIGATLKYLPTVTSTGQAGKVLTSDSIGKVQWSDVPATGITNITLGSNTANYGPGVSITPASINAPTIDTNENITGIKTFTNGLISSGTFKYTSGSYGSGKVLTSNSSGEASWVTPSATGITTINMGGSSYSTSTVSITADLLGAVDKNSNQTIGGNKTFSDNTVLGSTSSKTVNILSPLRYKPDGQTQPSVGMVLTASTVDGDILWQPLDTSGFVTSVNNSTGSVVNLTIPTSASIIAAIPTASSTVKGLVQVASGSGGLKMENGILSIDPLQASTLPMASASVLGGIKLGSGLTINTTSGVVSVDGYTVGSTSVNSFAGANGTARTGAVTAAAGDYTATPAAGTPYVTNAVDTITAQNITSIKTFKANQIITALGDYSVASSGKYGIQLDTTGQINAQRAADVDAIFKGYSSGGATTSYIDGFGNSFFSGTVSSQLGFITTGGVTLGDTVTDSIVLNGTIRIPPGATENYVLTCTKGVVAGATITGSITGFTLTVTAVTGTIVIGMNLSSDPLVGGSNQISALTRITAGSGTSWTVNKSQTVTSRTIIATSSETGTAAWKTVPNAPVTSVNGQTNVVKIRTNNILAATGDNTVEVLTIAGTETMTGEKTFDAATTTFNNNVILGSSSADVVTINALPKIPLNAAVDKILACSNADGSAGWLSKTIVSSVNNIAPTNGNVVLSLASISGASTAASNTFSAAQTFNSTVNITGNTTLGDAASDTLVIGATLQYKASGYALGKYLTCTLNGTGTEGTVGWSTLPTFIATINSQSPTSGNFNITTGTLGAIDLTTAQNITGTKTFDATTTGLIVTNAAIFNGNVTLGTNSSNTITINSLLNAGGGLGAAVANQVLKCDSNGRIQLGNQLVTSVKGSAESTGKTGNVSISAADVGAALATDLTTTNTNVTAAALAASNAASAAATAQSTANGKLSTVSLQTTTVDSTAYTTLTGQGTAASPLGVLRAPPCGTASGDLTGTYPSPTIGANKITYAQIQSVTAARLLGAKVAGNIVEIALGTGLSFDSSNNILNCSVTGSSAVLGGGSAAGSEQEWTGFNKFTQPTIFGSTISSATGTITGNGIASTDTMTSAKSVTVTSGYLQITAGRLLAYGNGGITSNTAIGPSSLNANTSGSNNVAVGSSALYYNTDGYSNTAIGIYALRSNLGGYSNTAIGQYASQSNTTGYSNVAVGTNPLNSNQYGNSNIAIGSSALSSVGKTSDKPTDGTYISGMACSNIAIGTSAMLSSTLGVGNVAVGGGALLYNKTDVGNTAIGNSALWNLIAPSIGGSYHNVAVGAFTGEYLESGYGNTLIGSSAGKNEVSSTTKHTGSNNVCIGYNCPVTPNTTGQVTIFNGSIKARFAGTSASTAWAFTSDSRDKNNIENLNFGLNFITKLQPRKYTWDFRHTSNNKGDIGSGFIAQEVLGVVESQNASCLGLVDTSDQNQFGVAQTNLIPVLVNAIKELNAKFEAYVATHP